MVRLGACKMARFSRHTSKGTQTDAFLGALVLIVVTSASICLGQNTAVTAGPDEESTAEEAILVWTELKTIDRRARIQYLPADPTVYITSSVISSKYYYELTPAHWIAITGDYADGVAFWSDASNKRIMKGGLREGASASAIFEGTSSSVDGIAVDWLANNLYWTDAAYDWIIVVDYNTTWFKIVIDDGPDKPRGIAIYPQLGYLFWTDWGSSQRIERATLSGEDRQVLIDTELHFPNGLAIDYAADKLYWTDADPSGSRLEVANLDGTNRSVVYAHHPNQGHFFDVTVFQNYIFISDWHNSIRCIHKDTGDHYFALNIGGRPFGLMVHGPGVLPGNSSPCDSKPCNQLCVSDPSPEGFKCLCIDGYVLMADNRTCSRSETSLAKPQILFVAQNSICYFPSNFPDLAIPPTYKRNCILANRSHTVALDVDVRGKILFFSDFVNKTIERVRLSDGAKVEVVIGGIGSVEGIAVDWVAQNLYWTDFQLDHIAVARYDGSNRHILLKDDIIDPRSIVVHPQSRLMFWTEFGPPSHIERASLDGSERRIIVSEVDRLNGLAIDFGENRLYYADQETGSIQSVDLDGNGRHRIYTRGGAQYFDIDIYKDYLLWTEWNTFNGLHALNRETRRIVQSYSLSNESAYGVRVYAEDRQPLFENVCEDNAGCQHLCLPMSTGGARCECSTGYTLHSDGRNCVPRNGLLKDDFLLASDTYLHTVFQFDLNDPELGYSALELDSRTIQNPVALAYDPIMEQVYWSDVLQNTIRRAYIANGSQEILFTNEHVDTPDGMTIDPTSRLLFWTDMGLPSIQVAHLDGSNRKSLVRTEIERPRAILADPGQGFLYWSDWGTLAKIERAYMDGTHRQLLVSSSLVWPNGLALDYTANQLYWCDAKTDVIEALNLDTMVRRVVVELGPDTHPFSLALHGSYLYWTDWSKKQLMRADKDSGENNMTVGPMDFSRLNGLWAYGSREHASFSNACVNGLPNGGCSVLCLPTPDSRVCACPDGSTLAQDEVTCSGVIQCPATFTRGQVVSECTRIPGSTCSVECDAGYRPSQTRVSCGHDGSWDVPAESICEQVTCPALSVPRYANVIACLAPHTYGNQCRYSCQVGYVRAQGDAELRCGEDGQWSGTLLSCEAVTCQSLPALSSGTYSPSECSTQAAPYNTTCRVICPQGYQLSGVASRMCQATGQWSQWADLDSSSSCIDISPPSFGDTCPRDINVTAPFGAITVNVTWPDPQATDNSGEEPNIASNIVQPLMLGEGLHSLILYATDSSGNAEICTFTITVTVLKCDMLGHTINGYFEHCTQHLGSVCVVRCNDGFSLSGDSQRTCIQEVGQTVWTGRPAQCELIECNEPATSVDVFKGDCTPPYFFRAECSYTCAPGFERVRGSERRICQDVGAWSGSELECQRKQCPPFVLSENAQINPVVCRTEQNYFGDVCVLSCEEGYQLVGVASHTCLASGEWSDADDEHFCQDIAAPHFNGTCPSDFAVIAPRGKTEAVVTWSQPVVMDNEGHSLNVTSTRELGVKLPEGLHAILIHATDGAGNRGTCRFVANVTVVHCPLHPFPAFGEFHGEPCHNYYGAECHFQCMVGYILNGSSIRTCEWSGQSHDAATWTGEQPRCEAVTCPMFDFDDDAISVEGCEPKAGALPFGSRCETICHRGTLPVSGRGDGGVRRCTENGTWSGKNVQCEVATCPPLPSPPVAFITPENCTKFPTRVGEMCFYHCPEGFNPRGLPFVLCVDIGHWVRLEQHTCQDIQPPVFEDPCPSMVTNIIPDACSNGSYVTYKLPQATDNSGNVTVIGGDVDFTRTFWPFGVYERSFTARDPSGNSAECLLTINILLIECPALSEPAYGSIVAQTCGNQAGSHAEFTCDNGYRLIGSQHLACGQNGQWNSTIPSCSDVYCSPLTLPVNGTFTPATECSGNAVQYGVTCEINCAQGYGLIGSSLDRATCLSNGQWSNYISQAVCLDITPPEFECPADQDYVLPLGEATMDVTLTVQTATDNSGVIPEVRPANIQRHNLVGPGDHFYHFSAEDGAGNTKECRTRVSVEDREAPTVVSCPSDTILQTNTLPVIPQWNEPVFNDNIGVRPLVSTVPNGKRVYRWGPLVVSYTATDASGNRNVCKFTIDIIKSTTCPPLAAPPNGALACENSDFCTVHCNGGYVFTDKNRPKDAYVCLDSGRWTHQLSGQGPPNLPACTKRDSQTRVRWERRDKYVFNLQHLQGTCEEKQEEIRTNFIHLFTRNIFMYCQEDPNNNCKSENIVISCGETSERRRKRRQVAPNSTMTADITVTLVIERNDTTDISSAIATLNTSASDLWGQQNMTLDNVIAILDERQTETGQVSVQCDVGMVASGMICVKCPKGTRYKYSLAECEPCGLATYQDEEGMSSCKLCSRYTTTLGTGAFDASQCKEMCPPGQMSSWGVTPCENCPVGSYQPQRGERGCEPCPDRMTTRIAGATTFSQCRAVVVEATTPMPSITHVIEATSQPMGTPKDTATIITTTPAGGSKSDLPSVSGTSNVKIVTKSPSGKDNNTGGQKSPQSTNLIPIVVGAVCAIVILIVIIAVAFIVMKRRRNSQGSKLAQRLRPVSWSGSTRAMLPNSEEYEEELDLTAINNPVFGLDETACTSPFSENSFTTFMDASQPPLFDDPSEIPKLAPPPKREK